jgi:hypothetical protein
VKALVAWLFLLAPPAAATAHAQLAPTRPDSAGVARASRVFLVAFDSLRWEPFAAVWAPAATVFLPDAEQPHLVSGRDAVLTYFRDLFAAVRAEAPAGTPSLQILPAVQDLRVQMAGDGLALVTFELGRGPAPGRRTLVWTWDARRRAWQLLHLHASRQGSE